MQNLYFCSQLFSFKHEGSSKSINLVIHHTQHYQLSVALVVISGDISIKQIFNCVMVSFFNQFFIFYLLNVLSSPFCRNNIPSNIDLRYWDMLISLACFNWIYNINVGRFISYTAWGWSAGYGYEGDHVWYKHFYLPLGLLFRKSRVL